MSSPGAGFFADHVCLSAGSVRSWGQVDRYSP